MKQLLLIFTISTLFISNVFAQIDKTERWYLGNGTQVVFRQALEVPILDIKIAFAAGSAYDGKDYGLSTLTTSLIDEGNGKLTANQIADAFAATGAQFQADSSRDMAVLSLRTLTAPKALNSSIQTLYLVVNQPNFTQTDTAQQKKQILMAIKESKESPNDIANKLFFEKLYKNHPYGHPIQGTIETISSLNAEKVRKFYKKFWVGKNAVIVLVGAIDSSEAHHIAQSLMGELPAGLKADPIPEAKPLASSETIQQIFPASQTTIRLGQTGVTHHNQDYFPLMVGNYILGGGTLVSRLGNEVREKRGLSYGISSQFIPMPGVGPFIIGLATKTQQTQEAVTITREILAKFLSDGPTPEEIKAAKQYLTGNFNVSLASNSAISNTLMRMAFYKLPDDYLEDYIQNIERVDIQDIKRAFDRVINAQRLLLIEVGQK